MQPSNAANCCSRHSDLTDLPKSLRATQKLPSLPPSPEVEAVLGALAVRLLLLLLLPMPVAVRAGTAAVDVIDGHVDVGVGDGGGVGALPVAPLDEGRHLDGRRLHAGTHHRAKPEGAATEKKSFNLSVVQGDATGFNTGN